MFVELFSFDCPKDSFVTFGDAGGLSSNKIREAGEMSSSNWPDLTPHKKAIKKRPATVMLAINNIMMTLICFIKIRVKISGGYGASGNYYQLIN
jgi:hypothetical protein